MNLKDIKEITDNLTDINRWVIWLSNQSIEELKRIKPATFSKLPKDYQYHLLLEKFNKIHNGRYDYREFTLDWFVGNYKDNTTKIPIICPKHGLFYQSAKNHLQFWGCLRCRGEKSNQKRKLSYQDFIDKANRIHQNKCIYSFNEDWWNKNYRNNKTKISIVCPIHGEYIQSVGDHLSGKGCKKCADEKLSSSKKRNYQDFIDKARQVHNNRYTYLFDKDWWQENYKDKTTKIPIVCPTHGEFKQSVIDHLCGSGCPVCNTSKGELLIRSILDKLAIKYIYQFKVKINGRNHYFDFYLPDHNTLIEYDGEQHFKPINGWGGVKTFEKIKHRDLLKDNFAKNHSIKLIRIPFYKSKEEIEAIITQLERR